MQSEGSRRTKMYNLFSRAYRLKLEELNDFLSVICQIFILAVKLLDRTQIIFIRW